MSKEILLVVESVSNEKGVEKDVIFEAIELALATAAKKRYEDEEADIRVAIDRRTGEYETFRRWLVVDNDAVPALGTELTMQEAEEIDTNLRPGDMHEEKVESVAFGRIGAQAAKQIIFQKMREAERMKIVDSYRDRIGELDLVAGPGPGALELVPDVFGQHVAADGGKLRRRLCRIGLFHQIAGRNRLRDGRVLADVENAVAAHLVTINLLRRDQGFHPLRVEGATHFGQRRIAEDQVIGQDHAKRAGQGPRAGAKHRMTQAQRLLLVDEFDIDTGQEGIRPGREFFNV